MATKDTKKKKATKAAPKKPAGASADKKTTEASQNAELVPLAEVARMLRMSPLQVRKMAQTKQIPGVKVDGEWRFNKDLVYQALKQRSRGM
jgi:excisionase family DNA binding protein